MTGYYVVGLFACLAAVIWMIYLLADIYLSARTRRKRKHTL